MVRRVVGNFRVAAASLIVFAAACAEVEPVPPVPPVQADRQVASEKPVQPAAAKPDAGKPEAVSSGVAIKACGRSGTHYRVFANIEWCDTGINLTRGQRLSIGAAGLWSNSPGPAVGPEGYENPFPGATLEDQPFAALIGEVGASRFLIGKSYAGIAADSGRLYLAMNDVPATFGDNRGFVDVIVKLDGATN